MINYSITVRAVNKNLIEINRAKGRVKKAIEDGVQPSEDDKRLAETPLITRAYGMAQYADVMTIESFAKHIAEHGCVYSRADISAILYLAVDCMREKLLDGKKIRLGDLGDFSLQLVSQGAESPEKFNAGAHITGINVVWDCGTSFKNLLPEAQFNLVATRAAQAAVLKAIKSGETVVDLSGQADSTENHPNSGTNGGGEPTTPPTGDDSTPSGGSGGGSGIL